VTNIDEIRKRDREAIPRLGPDGDPLLRAEMDRRWLLAEVERLTNSVGAFSSARDAAKRGWQEANDRVEDLQRQLAEAVGQAEAAKQATREIMAERNTWARQLADMRDERNTARNEAERQRGLASEASVDRDNLCVAVERVIEEWERSAARPLDNPMLNWQSRHAAQLRRALAPWLTT
jgi:chromosome segregation ATPase